MARGSGSVGNVGGRCVGCTVGVVRGKRRGGTPVHKTGAAPVRQLGPEREGRLPHSAVQPGPSGNEA